jgi:predicted amidohydrolase
LLAKEVRYPVAAVQYDSAFGQAAINIARLLSLAQAAARRGCRLIVLPEMATTGYYFHDRAEIAPLLDPVPGPTTQQFAALAAQHDCYILIGLPEIDPATGAAYNTAALVGPGGLVGRMRKVYLTEVDSRWARPGDLGFPVWETPIGRIAAHICRDACYPEAARAAALQGAQVIGLPTAWDSERAPANDWFTRAYENGVYYIAADRYRAERGTQFSGGSCVLGPAGDVLAHCDMGDGLAVAEIDLAPASAANRAGPALRERRPDLYSDLALNPLAGRWPLGRRRRVYKDGALPDGKRFGIAVVQPGKLPGEAGAAREHLERLIERALAEAGGRVELVILPELALVADVSRAADQAESVPGPTVEWAIGLCRRLGLHLTSGLPERDGNGRLFNSAVLAGPAGLLGVSRKLHLSDGERAWATPGDRPPQTWDLEPLGRVGLLVGRDAFFPEVARCLAIQGADVICAPAAVTGPRPAAVPQTAVPLRPEILQAPLEGHWHLWRARAGENNCYLAFANRADAPHMGWSGVFGPDLFRFPREECLASAAGEGIGWLAIDTRDYLEPNVPNPARYKEYVRARNTQFVEPLLR